MGRMLAGMENQYRINIKILQRHFIESELHVDEKSKRRDVQWLRYVIPTNLVCVFFGTAIPTSTFNFIQLFLYLYYSSSGLTSSTQCIRNSLQLLQEVHNLHSRLIFQELTSLWIQPQFQTLSKAFFWGQAQVSPTYDVIFCMSVCICWQLLSNQSFCRQFTIYGKGLGHHKVGQ